MRDVYASRRLPRKDLTGKVFGKLTVLGLHGRNASGLWSWLCQCSCGNQTIASGNGLQCGKVVTCKCSRGRLSWEPVPRADGSIGVPLTKGYMAIIDSDDLPLVRDFMWSVQISTTTAYAKATKGSRKWIGMHRVIARAGDGQEVDHKDGNGLNNRKDNLRICNHSENGCNKQKSAKASSQYKGVFWDTRSGKWVSRIKRLRMVHTVGTFASEVDAAKAYNEAAKRLHGEFASLNEIPA